VYIDILNRSGSSSVQVTHGCDRQKDGQTDFMTASVAYVALH